MRSRTVPLVARGVLSVGLAAGLAPHLAAAGPLAPLPGTTAAVDTARPPPPTTPAEQLSRGVVTVERNGSILAVGSVLGTEQGGGRVVTALSPLGTSDLADIRYADGSVVHARIGHKDKTLDLALLVPLTGRWFDGLLASPQNPVDAMLQAPVSLHDGRPAIVPAHIRGIIYARAREGADILPGMLDVELQGATPSLGAPLVDGNGRVVGVFVKACQPTLPMVAPAAPTGRPVAAPRPSQPCAPLIVAAPVAAIAPFLRSAPANAVTPTPWLGIVGVTDTESNTKGVRVMAIAPDSPAQRGGLKASDDRAQADMIVAVDAQPIDSPERLQEVIATRAIGERVKLLLLQGGKFHEVSVVLRASP